MGVLLRARVRLLVLFLCVVARPLVAVAAQKPTLVVVISVDQMRADYLERFRPYFGKDGFNRFLEHGAVFPEARHRHAVTFTGPGHAAIGTGLDPRHNGIVANRWFDVLSSRPVYCVEDARAAWAGSPSDAPKIPTLPASPVLLDQDSLGDRLKEKFPSARVVGMALKDRAAVLMAGRRADAALWFEERFARFVTSTYYPPRPSLLAFDARLPAFFEDPAHHRWDLSGRIPSADLEKITFDPPELADAKSPPDGFGTAFPHKLADPKQIISSPWGDVLLLDYVRFVIRDLRLGAQAGRPDLLFVGLSSTDYYGHWFGPDSKEIADGIVRLDASLESFFRWLDEHVGRDRVLLFLTSDHGVQPLPEVTRARQKAATGSADYSASGRVDLSNSRAGEFPTLKQLGGDRFALETFLARKFGYELDSDAPNAREGAVLFFEEPCLYVNRPVLARRRLEVEAVKQAARDWIRGRPGVAAAYTNTEILDGLPATDPYALAIERSFRADRSGDVFVVLKPGWMWSYGREAGTTHGQPNDDDARVPLAAWGPGVKAGFWGPKVSPISISRTVGALFGFEVGEPDADVLEPVLGRAIGTRKVMVSR